MRVQFKTDSLTASERISNTVPRWATVEDWPDAERVPGKGELARVGGREMRVLEVLQTGPRDAEVYLVPTYVTLRAM